MSFEKVRALLGQKDATGKYQLGLGELTGTLNDFDPKEWNKKGKPTQTAYVTDDEGENQKVTIYLGNGPEFLETDKGLLQRFTSVKPSKFGTYSAFWSSMNPPTPLPADQSYSPPTKPPFNPHVQTGASQGAKTKNEYNEREDARQLMIVRQSCLNRAVEIFITEGNLDWKWPLKPTGISEICQLAEKFKGYVYNGLGGMPNPGYVGGPVDEPDGGIPSDDLPVDDDIPFN